MIDLLEKISLGVCIVIVLAVGGLYVYFPPSDTVPVEIISMSPSRV